MTNMSHRAAQQYNKRLYEILSAEAIEKATTLPAKEAPMTDQPIIYWQDDSTFPWLTLRNPHPFEARETDALCSLEVTMYPESTTHLTRDQARSLGYALIARATVTTEGEDPPCPDGYQWSDTLGCVTIPE
jgi:hypothetical protein